MQKWEYIILSKRHDEDQLNELGERGWELVTITRISGYTSYFFKKPIDESHLNQKKPMEPSKEIKVDAYDIGGVAVPVKEMDKFINERLKAYSDQLLDGMDAARKGGHHMPTATDMMDVIKNNKWIPDYNYDSRDWTSLHDLVHRITPTEEQTAHIAP